MQVDGNYNSNYHSYSNSNYTTHNHHFTECLQEGQVLRKKESGANLMSEGVSLEISGNTSVKRAEEIVIPIQMQSNTPGAKMLAFFRGIWDSMGEKSAESREAAAVYEPEESVLKKGHWQGVSMMLSAVRQGFTGQIAERIDSVREKLKVGIHTALKRFGKESEPFGTLTDPGTGSLLGGKAGNGTRKNREEKGTRPQKEESIKTATAVNEHLMDSYSKKGTYCKINENLTYQQGRAPYKVSDKGETMK